MQQSMQKHKSRTLRTLAFPGSSRARTQAELSVQKAASCMQGTQGDTCSKRGSPTAQAGEQLQPHQLRAGKRLKPLPPYFLEPGILVENQRKPPALHSPGQRAHLSPELFDQQPDNIISPRTPSAEEVSSKLQ